MRRKWYNDDDIGYKFINDNNGNYNIGINIMITIFWSRDPQELPSINPWPTSLPQVVNSFARSSNYYTKWDGLKELNNSSSVLVVIELGRVPEVRKWQNCRSTGSAISFSFVY